MRYLIEHLAVIFGAATGALAARGKGIDWFGVVVLGIVTSVGGGTMRDVVLNRNVFWVDDHSFLVSAVLAVLVTIAVGRFLDPSSALFLVMDAIFLAFVAMAGTEKTYSMQHAWTICALFGVVTGVAGGAFRDVLLGEVPLVFRPQIELYATAALCGSMVYLLAARAWPGQSTNLILGAGVTLTLRLAAIRWGLRLPEFLATRPPVRPSEAPPESSPPAVSG